MDKIVAIPKIEVAGVKFGQKREDVKKILGEAKEFKKSKFSKNTTDDFGFCHAYYNVSDQLEAIEIFEGVCVYVNDKIIFPLDIQEIQGMFDDNWIIEDDLYINKSKSIGIFAPDGNPESILFGSNGYYE